MIFAADLHTHSTASDGQYTPADLVRQAKEAGITCLAITDHDTIGGVEQAIQAGREHGLLVLRGVELAAKENRHMHILGLGLHADCPQLAQLCQSLLNNRNDRNERIINFLQEKDVVLSLDEVKAIAGGQVVGRPHFAQAMVRKGYVANTREAFDRYLDTPEYQRIERLKASAEVCIQAIHQGGGKAVLAHPCQLAFSDEQLEETLRHLKELGLDGLECYYPQHTPAMVQKYLAFARKYDLGIMAGSDFHGKAVHPDKPLHPVKLELDWLLTET